MDRITYRFGTPGRRAERVKLLREQKFIVTDETDVTLIVLDGEGLDPEALDAELTALSEEGQAVLVMFQLAHGQTFRDRREALLALGARDVMAIEASEEEFLTRVRAILHQGRPIHVLVVEDNEETGPWAVNVLNDDRIRAKCVGTLADAIARFEAEPVDALVVDRGLPDGDGLDFVARLRELGIRTPALLFTALDDVEERIRGLEMAGADDYICKPIHADELKARVRLLLRGRVTDDTLTFGPLQIGRKDRLIRWRGDRMDLRRKECDMLIYLAERTGLPIPKHMIYLDVWGRSYMDDGSNPVATARHRLVKMIKTFLADKGEEYPEFIVTDEDCYVFQPEPLLQLSAA